MGRVDDKVVLISGGARGQGAAEGALLASEGASVVITDILDEQGEATAAGFGATYLHHDVTSEAEWATVVEKILAEHGRIDGLINNAGIFELAPMMMTSEEQYRRIIDINQVGVFLGMKAVVASMIDAGSGSIANISSVAGLRGAGMALAYAASKWAVRGMTKSAGLELAPFGVRVNSVHPGIINTPMLEAFDDAGIREQMRDRIPMGHEASADEVARLVPFLISDDSAYSTGSEFVIDGGMTA